jgi:hypothetical protein
MDMDLHAPGLPGFGRCLPINRWPPHHEGRSFAHFEAKNVLLLSDADVPKSIKLFRSFGKTRKNISELFRRSRGLVSRALRC